jgi:hypothetical protein
VSVKGCAYFSPGGGEAGPEPQGKELFRAAPGSSPV